MKKTKVLLVALFLTVSCAVFAEKTLKFVTINVWSGLTYDGTFKTGTYESNEERLFRYGLLVNALRKIDADVIGINEANMLPGYAKKLSRDLGYDYVYAVRVGGVRLGVAGFPINLREGHVILAKKYLNLTSAGNRGLSGGYAGNFASFHLKDAERILGGKITVGEREVYLFCTQWHGSEFSSDARLKALVDLYAEKYLDGPGFLTKVEDAVVGSRRRLEEAEKTLGFVAEVAGNSAAVLFGSLNAIPESAEIKVLLSDGFKDAWDAGKGEGYTVDGTRNTNMIRYLSDEKSGDIPKRCRADYILYRGEGIRALNARIALDETTYDTHPSDHFAVIVELEF